MVKTNGYCILNSKHPCRVGQSENTNQKETDIRKWFRLHQKIVNYILKNNRTAEQTYYYFDIGCGPGLCEKLSQNRISGSPIQFLETIYKNNLNTKAFFFEKDKYCCQTLFKHISRCAIARIIHGNAQQTIPKLLSELSNRFKLGLIYMDYNGAPDFNLLKYMASNRKTKYLDILVNVPIGSHKREYGLQEKHPEFNYKKRLNPLSEDLNIKKNICCKGPKPGKNQWTLFYLTNWKNIEWKKEGWKPYEPE